MKKFPINKWISVNQTYTNATYDLEIFHCLGPGEKIVHDQREYVEFYYDKVICINYGKSEKVPKIIKSIKIENKPKNWSHGLVLPSNYKIHDWSDYFESVLQGIIYAVFTKLEIKE